MDCYFEVPNAYVEPIGDSKATISDNFFALIESLRLLYWFYFNQDEALVLIIIMSNSNRIFCSFAQLGNVNNTKI